MDNNFFWKVFTRRTILCFAILMLLFLSCILRVAVTATSDMQEAYQYMNCYKLKISDLRGTIFDCNMVPLTNNVDKIIAAVSPTKKGIAGISSILKGDSLQKVLNRLNKGEPAVCEIPKDIKFDGITTTKIKVNSGNLTPAIHLIGYTDKDNNGVSGIEAAYNDILHSQKEAYVYFESDGKGRILQGAEAIIENDTSVAANGVITTLDINIQNIAESVALNLEKGAIVVAEAETGKIRAMVSRPFFDCENIGSYLDSTDSPMLNRAINSYNVGSVFKPCVAASGIENNIVGFQNNCKGYDKINDRIFKCHKIDGHGILDLKDAIANSCNTYFYNFARKIGYEKIYNMASILNFGKKIKLCNGIYTADGNLTAKNELSNESAIANFSIGQGKLLLTPVSILTLYCAIATDGTYYLPSVVEGITNNGKTEKYDNGEKTRAMSKKTSDILKDCLSAVITNGTGEEAKPKTVTAAGKTATAQTGKYENGVEISQGWFCGFFPTEKPKYVVVVFSENTKKQIKSCNQIFAEIADSITALES